MLKTSTIIFAAIIMLVLASDGRAAYMSYGGSRESPEMNIYLSARYDHLLQISPRFRHHRMWKECHTINWVPLHGDCIASFDQFEPVLPEYGQHY
jgi:hypothetical protein